MADPIERYRFALAAYNFGAEKLDDAIARLADRRGPRAAAKPKDQMQLAFDLSKAVLFDAKTEERIS